MGNWKLIPNANINLIIKDKYSLENDNKYLTSVDFKFELTDTSFKHALMIQKRTQKIEKKQIKQVLKAEALAKADGKSAGKSNKKDAKNIKNIAYYLIPVDFEIDGNFIGYIKFKRALSLSNKMLNFDKESIQVVQGDSTGAIKVRGTLTIVGLPDEFF